LRVSPSTVREGNAIVADTPLELSALVERADLDPAVTSYLVSGRAKAFAQGSTSPPMPRDHRPRGGQSLQGHVLSGNRRPSTICPPISVDPMIDYQLMSRLARLSSLMHADKPDGREDPRLLRWRRYRTLHCMPTSNRSRRRKIGYPPTRVWECPPRVCGRIGSATNAPNAF